MARQYYRGSVGALLCYDITRRATFDSVAAWLADARALASPDLVCVLVGTKVRWNVARSVLPPPAYGCRGG